LHGTLRPTLGGTLIEDGTEDLGSSYARASRAEPSGRGWVIAERGRKDVRELIMSPYRLICGIEE